MRPTPYPTRRQFVELSGLIASGLLVAADKPSPAPSPDEVLRRLLEGNKRFMKGETTAPRRKPEDFAKLAEGQTPLAVIVGCADSRVPPEILFDQGVGDLFVVRVAGNVVSGAGATLKGSIEYAVAVWVATSRLNATTDLRAFRAVLAEAPAPVFAIDLQDLALSFNLDHPVVSAKTVRTFEDRVRAGERAYLVISERAIGQRGVDGCLRPVARGRVTRRHFVVLEPVDCDKTGSPAGIKRSG